MALDHVLPADGVHDIRGMAAIANKQRVIYLNVTKKNVIYDSRVDKLYRLRLQLVGAMQIGQNQRLGGRVDRQADAERLLAHHFQLLEGVLRTSGNVC